MRIKNKFKFIRGIFLIVFIISAIFCHSTLSYKNIEYTKIYVERGDTLWTIAKNLKQSNTYYKNKDIREIIYEIQKINNLSNGDLYVNQVLLISNICK